MVFSKLQDILTFSYYVFTNSFEYYTHSNSQTGLNFVTEIINKSNDNFDMNEIRGNTDELFSENTDKNKQDYTNIVSYMSGYCYMNSKLSHGLEINDKEKSIIQSINRTVDRVKPLSYPVTLFHGFEILSKYNDKNWRVGNSIGLPGFLSKTPSLNVSTKFAYAYNKYRLTYLVVNYPINSQHINLDIKSNANEEFEYLTRSNEQLKLKDIVKIYKFPSLFVFYVCDPK
ncbi:MAG: putative orfan [Terrestrivirus sp.]|uniref:Putative orfan n=1 Tax=Terrestrivirus sp. TaxID=2487775 RepID=A0A3G4ZL50_9VIRU|nr:MAG: putative orfan [Terrestrivirus sp.]